MLDDGWFGKRDNDESSLGDWVANTTKFPHGIKGLAEEVNAAGCKFGLWFEPEMVSEDSVSLSGSIEQPSGSGETGSGESSSGGRRGGRS